MKSISIGGAKLTVEELIAVARKGARVQLSEEAIAAIDRSRQVVEKCVERRESFTGLQQVSESSAT